MSRCLVCLEEVAGNGDYHPACVAHLFGTTAVPGIPLELSQLYQLAADKMAGKMSISGAQEKLSLSLSADNRTLEPTPTDGRYILKPETLRYSAVPQNEHLTMRMARLLALEVPPCGLVRLRDRSTAYIVKRFDRLDDGTKLSVEDFCQLAQKRPKEKYDGSAELCVRLLNKYATEPVIEIQRLYRLLLYCWWTANGDMHLKNFSLLTTLDGIRRLAPAYDLVCTQLVIPHDTLAMPIQGRDRKLTRRTWLDFADYCKLPQKAAKRLISRQTDVLDVALERVAASSLPEPMKRQYQELLRENTAVLAR